MVRIAILLMVCVSILGCSESGKDLPPPPRPSNPDAMEGEVRAAVEAQLELVDTAPGDTQARAQLARLYQANSLTAESIATWEQVLVVADSQPKYWYFLALAHQRDGDLEAAITAAARSRSLDPRYPGTWWRPAFWELDMGRPAEAEPLARQAIALDSNNAGGYVALARALVAMDQTDEAIQVLKQLQGLTSHPYILYLLGQTYQRAGQPEQAEAYLINGQAQQPDYPDAWNLEVVDAQRGLDATLGKIDRLLELGRIDEAVTAIFSAQQTWPSNVNLIHRRSETFRIRGDTKRWILELKNALRIEPDNAVTHLNLSIAYLQDKNLSLAMNHAIASSAANPLMPRAHLQMGRIFLMNNELDKAVESLDEAFRLGVQDHTEQLQYALVLLNVSRFEEAERHAQQVTTVDPTNPLAWGVLAESRYVQGHFQAAMEALNSGIQADPLNQQLLGLHQRFQQGAPGRPASP